MSALHQLAAGEISSDFGAQLLVGVAAVLGGVAAVLRSWKAGGGNSRKLRRARRDNVAWADWAHKVSTRAARHGWDLPSLPKLVDEDDEEPREDDDP